MRETLGHLRFRTRAWTATLSVAVVALAAAPSAAQAVPGKFWGVVPQSTPSAEQLQRLKRGGVDSLRIPISWSSVQSVNGGAFDWGATDSLIGAAATAGIEVLPFLYGAPTWAVPSAVVPGSHGTVRAPKVLPVVNAAQRSGWQRFVREAVLRYGPAGSFWAENPAVPPRPIRVWQIWNEPNFKYFVVRPNPAQYGKLVNLSYAAARSADGGAKIVLAGLFAHPIEATKKLRPKQAYFAADFLNRMYDSTPGIKRKFHGVALHPYTGEFQTLIPYIDEIRAALAAHRDVGKGLWLTELGWSSQPPRAGNSFAKGRKGQVTQLKGAFRLLRANQRRWRLKRIYWFSVTDQVGSCNFCDGSGLFTEAFVPKPSWRAYVGFAG